MFSMVLAYLRGDLPAGILRDFILESLENEERYSRFIDHLWQRYLYHPGWSHPEASPLRQAAMRLGCRFDRLIAADPRGDDWLPF